MKNSRLLKAIQEGLIPCHFNGANYGENRPHCVIGELAFVRKMPTTSDTFYEASKLFTKKEYDRLNNGIGLTYEIAHSILRNAIKRHLKKETK